MCVALYCVDDTSNIFVGHLSMNRQSDDSLGYVPCNGGIAAFKAVLFDERGKVECRGKISSCDNLLCSELFAQLIRTYSILVAVDV